MAGNSVSAGGQSAPTSEVDALPQARATHLESPAVDVADLSTNASIHSPSYSRNRLRRKDVSHALVWGAVMWLFGALFLFLARRAARTP